MSAATICHWRTRYVKLKIKFKASLEERMKLVKILNEENSLMINKIEIIDDLQQKKLSIMRRWFP